ncbi:hypothetical protein B484DRAFT_407411 [Ochromonadaceae sp. CCMP2298]|nr:hypothetical protein B484DRAFT_407411 [Ochromonadaceae sp. CCMP2298]
MSYAIKKSPLTPAERATVMVLAQFCLDNGLVRVKASMDIIARIADAKAAEKADRDERAAEYYRQYLADLDEAEWSRKKNLT